MWHRCNLGVSRNILVLLWCAIRFYCISYTDHQLQRWFLIVNFWLLGAAGDGIVDFWLISATSDIYTVNASFVFWLQWFIVAFSTRNNDSIFYALLTSYLQQRSTNIARVPKCVRSLNVKTTSVTIVFYPVTRTRVSHLVIIYLSSFRSENIIILTNYN